MARCRTVAIGREGRGPAPGDSDMANIGSFKRIEDGTISGEIRTLKFKTQARFVAVEDKASEQSPDFRIFAPGKVELGCGLEEGQREPGSPTTRCRSTILPSPPRSTPH